MSEKFENEETLIDWYLNKTKRVFTEDFVSQIPWQEATYDIDPVLVPVIRYMGDIETLTRDRYFPDLMRTPSGKDPIFVAFMKKWAAEEEIHGWLLHKYLGRSPFGYREYQKPDPIAYSMKRRVTDWFVELIPNHFKATHMVLGLAAECTTRLGYELLVHNVKDPFLIMLLQNIIREESVHAKFYAEMARIKLEKSRLTQRIARYGLQKFWMPPGGTERDVSILAPLIAMFKYPNGISEFELYVAQKMKKLPGFGDFDLTARFEEHISFIYN